MIKKIVLGFLVFIVLILAAAIILPIVYKGKIVQMVKDEANKNLNAVVNFGEFDITLIKSFPDFSLALNDLSITGINDFKSDTLASIKVLSVTLDVMSVIKGDKINIKSIVLHEPRIHAIVLKTGKANWDIAKPTAPTKTEPAAEPSKFNVKLKKFAIENGYVVYEDATMGLWTQISGLNHTLQGDFTQDNFLMKTMTEMENLSLSYGGVKYLSKAKTILKADLDMDMKNSKYTFKENELKLNELIFGMDGWLAMPKEDITMDLKFGVKKTDFRNFISMVPGVYTKDFADAKTSGKLGFDGYAKGTYNTKSMPAFGINLLIQNGMLKYPALPSALNNVQVNLAVTNPDGKPDHTLINLSKMHIELGAEPFDMKLIVKTPVSDAQIDASLKGKVNLANILQIIPLEKGTKLAGIVTVDLTANGRMSSIDKKEYEKFNAAGQLTVSNLVYSSADMPQTTSIRTIQMTFNPRNVTLNNFDGSVGRTDMQMNGTLDNFIAYAMRNEVLKGTLNFNSHSMDVNEFMKPEPAGKPAAAADTTPLNVFPVPANIDFTLTASIGKMIYDNMTLTNMKGMIIIRNEAINMSGLSMNMLDGRIVSNGSYSTKNPRKPDMDFDMEITDFDIQQTVKTFPSIKTMCAVTEKAYGKYSTKFKVKGQLDEHLQPVLNSLNGGGGLTTKSVSIVGYGPQVKVAEALKMKKYEKLDLNNVNLTFKFKDGRVNVDPFDVKLDKTKVRIGGSNGFDQTIDYTMNFEIPREEFGGQANTALNSLVTQANSKGAKFSIGETVNLAVKVGGTVKDPKITTGLKDAANNMVDDLKNKAKEELDKKKKELEDKAKAEADKAKKDAEDKVRAEGDKAKKQAEDKAKAEADKAKAAADKAKKEAEDKARAEADKAKKAAEEKAKKDAGDKMKGLFNKPK